MDEEEKIKRKNRIIIIESAALAVLLACSGTFGGLFGSSVSKTAETSTQLKQTTEEKEDLAEQVATLNNEIITKNQQITTLQTQIDSLTVELQTATTDKESLQSQIDSLTTTKNNLESEVAEKQQEIENLNSQLASLTVAANTFTVFYVANNGIVATKTVSKGNSVTDVPAVPEKAGYSGEWSNDGTNITSDLVIYPVYTYEDKDYKVNLLKANVYDGMSVSELIQSADKVVFGRTSKYADEVYGDSIDVGETEDDNVKVYYFEDGHTGKKDLYFLADGDIVIENDDYTDNVDQSTVKEVYGTYADYVAADHSSLSSGDVFKVLKDETHYGVTSYFTYTSDSDEPGYSSDQPSSPFSLLGVTRKLVFENVDTSSITSFSSFFFYSPYLETIDLSGLDTENSTNFNKMFCFDVALKYIDTSYLDTSNATEFSEMFGYCTGLTGIDVSTWNTDKVTSLNYMFFSSAIETLDISTWNLGNVTTMSSMFQDCMFLASLTLGDNCYSPKLKTVDYLFDGCERIATLDLSKLNLDGITTLESTFEDCYALRSITWPTDMKTTALTNLDSAFEKCYALYGSLYTLELDLTALDTSNVTSMNRTFMYDENVKTIDISTWDLSKVTSCDFMFAYCTALTTIYVKDGTDMSTMYGLKMFDEDPNLVGQNGTANTQSEVSDQAKVDTVGNGGVFSVKNPYTMSINNASYGTVSITVNGVAVSDINKFYFKAGDVIKITNSREFMLDLGKLDKSYSLTEDNISKYGSTVYACADHSYESLSEYTFTVEEGYSYYAIIEGALA